MQATSDLKYHGMMRILHWIMMLAFAVLFVLGIVMVTFKDAEPWTLYEVHKSTGVVVFLLVWLRLATRRVTRVPPYPEFVPSFAQRLASFTAILLYIGMIIVPITGYATSNVNGYEVKLYGLPLPRLFPENQEWAAFATLSHYYAAYAFLGVIGLHIMGVVYHHVQGQDILRRMT